MSSGGTAGTQLKLRIEHNREAFGIGTDRPRLSWIVETAAKGWRQGGYEIEAYANDGSLHGRTGWIESDQSAQFQLTREQVSAMKEAGMWDDPVKRPKMIKRYIADARQNKGYRS